MTRKEQIKILNDKIRSNANQYKIDRLNGEISAFSSGDLNKYEFLTKKDLKYKPNALDKAKFEFSPLGKAFSTGLDKAAVGYQEEGVIKLLKDIRDGLAGNVNRPNNRPDDNNDDDKPDDRPDDRPDDGPDDEDDGDDNADMSDLETEEEAADFYEQKKESKTSDDDKIKNLKDRILYLEAKLRDNKLSVEEKDKLYKEFQNKKAKIYNMSNKFKYEMEKYYNKLSKADDILDESNDRLNKLNDKIIKIKKVLDDKTLSDDERNKLQNEIKYLNRELKEEKNKETIHNQNLITTRKLQKLMKEKKDVEKIKK